MEHERYPLTCRVPSHYRRGGRNAQLGTSSTPVRFTGRILEDTDDVRTDDDGRYTTVWCSRCGRATEYAETPDAGQAA